MSGVQIQSRSQPATAAQGDACNRGRAGSVARDDRDQQAVLSASGEGNHQLADDRSERIYTADHGLRRAGIRGARRCIATALNAAGWKIASRSLTDIQWEPYEVYEPVKQYERGLRERFGNREITGTWGESKVSKWGLRFRSPVAEGQAPKRETEEA
jgi:hypothetical protein